jgi:hypothetical protein
VGPKLDIALQERRPSSVDENRLRPRRSTQHLRNRVRYHYRGNAEGSTLRLTLSCLLGLELRRVVSGKRMTSGKDGEPRLTEHARVCWIQHPNPWSWKTDLIAQLDLPFNLDQNKHNPFHPQLTALRAEARKLARALSSSAKTFIPRTSPAGLATLDGRARVPRPAVDAWRSLWRSRVGVEAPTRSP